ncbi:hypothetical protein V1511DRAFT_485595 [Dipodascopsis uninucleata]
MSADNSTVNLASGEGESGKLQAMTDPIRSIQRAQIIEGHRIDIIAYDFADKIMILISKDGRLGKMYYVPITTTQGAQSYAFDSFSSEDQDNFSILPLNTLTPHALLGSSADDTLGRLYAVQIASLIAKQSPNERRTVVLGLASDLTHEHSYSADDSSRNEFLDIITMVNECKVW